MVNQYWLGITWSQFKIPVRARVTSVQKKLERTISKEDDFDRGKGGMRLNSGRTSGAIKN